MTILSFILSLCIKQEVENHGSSYHPLTLKIYNKKSTAYLEIIANKDYKKALLFYNNKGLPKMISSPLGLKPGEYRESVLRLLTTEYKDAIVAGLKK